MDERGGTPRADSVGEQQCEDQAKGQRGGRLKHLAAESAQCEFRKYCGRNQQRDQRFQHNHGNGKDGGEKGGCGLNVLLDPLCGAARKHGDDHERRYSEECKHHSKEITWLTYPDLFIVDQCYCRQVNHGA